MEHRARDGERAGGVLLVPVIVDATDGEDEALKATLVNDEELSGFVRSVPAASPSGTLGNATDVLAIVYEHAPLAFAVSTALVGFLKYRTSDISLEVKGTDGREARIEAVRVRGKTVAQLEQAILDAVQEVNGGPPAPPGDG